MRTKLKSSYFNTTELHKKASSSHLPHDETTGLSMLTFILIVPCIKR